MDTTTAAIYITLTILVMAIVALIASIIILTKKFKWQFNVKEIVNNRIIKNRTRAREVNKNGYTMLKILKYGKYLCPMPPPEAIELNRKGKKCVDVYFIDGQFIFNKDNIAIINDENINEKLVNEKQNNTLNFFKWVWPKKFKGVVGQVGIHTFTKEFIKTDNGLILKEEYDNLSKEEQKGLFKDNKIPDKLNIEIQEFKASKWLFSKEYDGTIEVVEPFTTEQRELLVGQIAKAKEDSGQSWQEVAMKIGAIAFIAFLLIMSYLHVTAYYDGNKEVMGQFETTSDNMKESSANLNSATSRWAQILGDDSLDLSKRDSGGGAPN